MVGFLVHINHIHFPGMLSPTFGVSFESLSAMGPFDAWNSIPLLGQIQILGSNLAISRHCSGDVEDVLELADVAWPTVGKKARSSAFGKAASSAVALQKVIGQQQDVTAALTQRR